MCYKNSTTSPLWSRTGRIIINKKGEERTCFNLRCDSQTVGRIKTIGLCSFLPFFLPSFLLSLLPSFLSSFLLSFYSILCERFRRIRPSTETLDARNSGPPVPPTRSPIPTVLPTTPLVILKGKSSQKTSGPKYVSCGFKNRFLCL